MKKFVYQTCLTKVYETFITGILMNKSFLLKLVCLIEVSPKLMQEATKFTISMYAILAGRVN